MIGYPSDGNEGVVEGDGEDGYPPDGNEGVLVVVVKMASAEG